MILAAMIAFALQEPREVLCLHDSAEPAVSRTHLYAEVVLNHLGLIAVYRDVRQPLPSEEEMSRYRGILTWFADDRSPKAEDYWDWIASQARAGRKIVILGTPGATSSETINRGLAPLGLTYAGEETENAAVLEIVAKDPLVEFERTLEGEFRSFVLVRSDPKNRVYLKARRLDRRNSESDLVVTGPWGGFAWCPVHEDEVLDRVQWRIDPFAFFARAFEVERTPRMDLATAEGRRIFFAHVDGDGFCNRVRSGTNRGKLAAEVVRDSFFRKYNLPVTASVIAADLEKEGDLARSIFELPNVEPAAHGFYHPLDWRTGTVAYPGAFSLDREIREAAERVQALSPKKVGVYLWTGIRNPDEAALALCEKAGLIGFNATDSYFDERHPSYAHVQPVTVPRGGRRQLNNRASSENNYTELWTTNFGAFRNVIETYRRTEEPVRILPVDLYYHYYVVEHPAGERALRDIYDWVLEQDLHPMTVAQYAGWVDGFYRARVERIGDARWSVRDYASCRTVRFDDEDRTLDESRSKNVLGSTRKGRSLYLHLAAGDEAVIELIAGKP